MNLNNYADQCGILEAEVGNIKTWIWPKEDTQTFGLIVADWFNSIRPFILERFKGDRSGSVIQAGGNCGVYPLLFTELFEQIYTFEPDPLNFFCLTNNCQFPNIVKFNAALADKNQLVSIKNVSPVNRGMIKIEEASSPDEDVTIVPAVTIDSFEFQNVKLMQLDLEGFEVNAISGAIQTIEKYKPIIILESGDVNSPADQKHLEQVKDKMKSINYKSLGHINRLDIAFVPE
jgi:FkbM family methyltransferase